MNMGAIQVTVSIRNRVTRAGSEKVSSWWTPEPPIAAARNSLELALFPSTALGGS